MSILDDVTQWSAPDGTRPPEQWNGTAWEFGELQVHASLDALYEAIGLTVDNPSPDLAINYVGAAKLPSFLIFNLEYTVESEDAELVIATMLDGNFVLTTGLANLNDPTMFYLPIPDGTDQFSWEFFAIAVEP